MQLVGAFEGLTEIGLAAQIQLQFLEDYPAWFLLREEAGPALSRICSLLGNEAQAPDVEARPDEGVAWIQGEALDLEQEVYRLSVHHVLVCCNRVLLAACPLAGSRLRATKAGIARR